MKTATALFVLAGAASLASASVSTLNVGHFELNGDFVVGGASTRTSAGAPDPAIINMPAIPGGVVRSYAVWNYLTDSPNKLDEPVISVNGTTVGATFSNFASPDLCWGKAGIATYIADVTGLVIHGGANKIGSAGDDPFTAGLGEGVSLLTVYRDAASPFQSIDVFWDGLSGQIANNMVDGQNNWKFSNAYLGGKVHGFTNALDGQAAGDDFIINGNIASGLFGTFVPGDAWIGNLGPYYDHAEGDFQFGMTPGDTSMDIGTTPMFSDCIGHTFGAMAFRMVPSPSTMALAGLGGLLAGRRRR